MLHKINLFLRSLLFSILMMIATIFYSLFCLSVYCFISRASSHYLIMRWTRGIIWLLKVTCNVNYHVEGFENIPKDRNTIIFSKHQSTWETFFLPSLFHETAIILKRELLWVPFFGWGLATTDPIAINRNKGDSAMEQIIKKGGKYLEAGRSILIFPEGTRITPGKVGKYRVGGARLAVATGYPIIPIAHDAGLYWPKRGFIKNPGTVQVRIGPLIETQNRTPEEVLQAAKGWIEDAVKKISSKKGS